MKHLGITQRKESNMNQISSTNKAKLVSQADLFIPSVTSDLKTSTLINEYGKESYLNIGYIFMVDKYYSPITYRPHQYGYIIGHDYQSNVLSYSVKYTPRYDSGKNRGRDPLNECTRRSYSDSYFEVVSVRKKVKSCVNSVTLEKMKVKKRY